MSVSLLWVGSFGKVLEPQWLKAVYLPWLLGEKQTALLGVRTLWFFSKLRMPQSSTSPREGALFLYLLLTGSGSDTGLEFLSCQGSLGKSAINSQSSCQLSMLCWKGFWSYPEHLYKVAQSPFALVWLTSSHRNQSSCMTREEIQNFLLGSPL